MQESTMRHSRGPSASGNTQDLYEHAIQKRLCWCPTHPLLACLHNYQLSTNPGDSFAPYCLSVALFTCCCVLASRTRPAPRRRPLLWALASVGEWRRMQPSYIFSCFASETATQQQFLLLKPPPGSGPRSGLKNPLGLLESSRDNSF
jgi:hypothetical protein